MTEPSTDNPTPAPAASASEPDAAPQPGPSPAPPRICPSFRPGRFQLLAAADRAGRWLLLVLVVLVVVLGGGFQSQVGGFSVVMLLAIGGWWFWLVSNSSRAMQALAAATVRIDAAPVDAEAILARWIHRLPMQAPIRLLLHHRLAMLRHRQGRWAEATAICIAVLRQPFGGVDRPGGVPALTRGGGPRLGPVRAHLLLLLADARLHQSDLWGAWQALSQLHEAPLGLLESLQRLALQTRYEIMAGYPQHALAELDRKIRLAELMPPAQCGALHALLAVAARRTDRPGLAQWLQTRAELLGTPDQLRLLTA